MKRFFVVAAALIMSAGIASAQTLNEAAEIFENARTAFANGDKAGSVALFTQALDIANALGDEGAELASDCKKNIPAIELSILRDAVVEGAFDKAIADYDGILAKAKDFAQEDIVAELEELIPQIWNEKGKSLNEAEDFEGAVAAFGKVLELDPSNGNTAARLGQALTKLNKLEEAKDAYLKAKENGVAVEKQLGNTTLKLAQAALKEKKFGEAYKLAVESAEYAENASAFQIAASAAQQGGKFKDAISAYEKFLELKPDAPAQIKYNLATCYEKAGNKAKAIEFYKKVTSDAKYGKNAAAKIQALGGK